MTRLEKTRFIQFFGATESGLWTLYQRGPENMDYLSIDACHMGIDWRAVAGDSETETQVNGSPGTQSPPAKLYEPVFVRFKDPVRVPQQPIFHVFPELDEYATRDLFAPHPTRPDTWKFVGRADDLILFGHGIKFHPGGIEARIRQSNERIREVLMWGDGHQQAILLVELTEPGLDENENGRENSTVRGELDVVIDQINLEAPVIAQLAKTHVIFMHRAKPLPRTSKGSIRRKEAAKIYSAEIDEVYRVHGDKMGRMMSRVQ